MLDKNLLTRIGNKDLRAGAARAFEVASEFEARRAELDQDARFTDQGRTETLAAELRSRFAPRFRAARQIIKDARTAIGQRKAKIVLPPVDPKDVAAQLRGMELRAYLAGLAAPERTRILFNEADPQIVDAALNAPAALSGVPPERRSELLTRRLRQLHGPEMEAVAGAERDLAEAEAVVAVATNDMRASFNPKARDPRFDELMNKAMVPWLIDQGGGQVVVVKIDASGQASYPPASELEKKTGKFFKSRAEYEAQAA